MSQTLEIACDESGAEGEKLVGGNSDVFAHASVLMDAETATACVAELRERAPTPATEYRASHVLRGKHRAALLWLLGPEGPVLGKVRVFLTDKLFYVAGKVTGLLEDDHAPRLGLDPHAAATAAVLYREGPGPSAPSGGRPCSTPSTTCCGPRTARASPPRSRRRSGWSRSCAGPVARQARSWSRCGGPAPGWPTSASGCWPTRTSSPRSTRSSRPSSRRSRTGARAAAPSRSCTTGRRH
ncbi:hypothetical protein ACFQYP_15380 [Nonomuraea antimicrobica]